MQTTPRVRYGKTDDAIILVATGTVTHYDYKNTGDQSEVTQQHVYHSGLIHHTVLDKLEPSVEYWYECGDEHTGGGNRLTFVSPPRIDGEQNLPYSVGITGDLGQTNDSHTNVVHWMEDRDLRSVICVGDESYADDLQGRWDSWARLVQPVAARLPWMVAAGNRELQLDHAAKRHRELQLDHAVIQRLPAPVPHAIAGERRRPAERQQLLFL